MHSVDLRKETAAAQYNIIIEALGIFAKKGRTSVSSREILADWGMLLPEVVEKLAKEDGYDVTNYENFFSYISWFDSAEGRTGKIKNLKRVGNDDSDANEFNGSSDENPEDDREEFDDSGDDDSDANEFNGSSDENPEDDGEEFDDSGDDDSDTNEFNGSSDENTEAVGKESVSYDREGQIKAQLDALDEAEKRLKQKQADAAATANSPKKRKLL